MGLTTSLDSDRKLFHKYSSLPWREVPMYFCHWVLPGIKFISHIPTPSFFLLSKSFYWADFPIQLMKIQVSLSKPFPSTTGVYGKQREFLKNLQWPSSSIVACDKHLPGLLVIHKNAAVENQTRDLFHLILV